MFGKIARELKMITEMIKASRATPKTVPQMRFEDLDNALNMALWASNCLAFNDFCNRADIFGKFILHHDDREEAKKALDKYIETVCQQEYIPRWMRRDILFNCSQHFLEPDMNDVYSCVLNKYACGEMLCEKIEVYHAATEEERAKMRDEFDHDVLKLLDRHYRKEQYYRENAEYIKELDDLVDSIQCDRYGI